MSLHVGSRLTTKYTNHTKQRDKTPGIESCNPLTAGQPRER